MMEEKLLVLGLLLFIVVLYIGIRLILKYNKDIIWKIKNEI